MKRAWMVATAAALCACGSGNQSEEALHDATGVQSTSNGTSAELRLLGVDAGGFSLVGLEVESVRITAHGTVLTDAVLTDEVDLSNMTQAWLLAKFDVPAGETELDATLSIRDGGAFVALHGAGEVRAGCSVIHVTLPVALLMARGHAVIHLDVARSLQVTGDGAELVPNFSLHF